MRLSDLIGALDISAFPQIALVIFLITFGALCVRLFRTGSRSDADRASLLPLQDDAPTPKDTTR